MLRGALRPPAPTPRNLRRPWARRAGEAPAPVRWEDCMDSGVRVPTGPAPRPVAEGNCVTVRWGGEQPEAKRWSAEPVPGLTREDEPDSAKRRGEPAGERRSRGEETGR